MLLQIGGGGGGHKGGRSRAGPCHSAWRRVGCAYRGSSSYTEKVDDILGPSGYKHTPALSIEDLGSSSSHRIAMAVDKSHLCLSDALNSPKNTGMGKVSPPLLHPRLEVTRTGHQHRW
jgi:hypothetical protein